METIDKIKNNDVHAEGNVAKAIEQQTAKLPSDLFLWTAAGTTLASIGLKLCNQNHTALLVGQWTAPLLILGLYNKLVKVEGHDKADKEE